MTLKELIYDNELVVEAVALDLQSRYELENDQAMDAASDLLLYIIKVAEETQ